MMRKVREDGADLVIYRSLSRLGRYMRDSYNTVHEIVEDHSVGLIVAKDGIDTEADGSPPETGRIEVESFRELIGEWESSPQSSPGRIRTAVMGSKGPYDWPLHHGAPSYPTSLPIQ